MNNNNKTPYYNQKLKQGIEYQDFVCDQLYNIGIPLIAYGSKKYQTLKGENKIGIEIKFDDKYIKTNNLYIEIAEKSKCSNKNWINSGIYRTDNLWLYLIGNYEIIYIFGVKFLRLLHQTGKYKEIQIPTSKGFLLSEKDAIKYNLKVIMINQGQ